MEAQSNLPDGDESHSQGGMPLRPHPEEPSVSSSNAPALTSTSSSQHPPRPTLTTNSGGTNSDKKPLLPTTNASKKVAIPRQRSGAAPRYARRVPLACESCRHRKTKCSGDTPVCRQCKELRVSCRYPISWRERTKTQLNKLSTKTSDYENLLRDLSSVVDGRAAERIKLVLEKHSGSESTATSTEAQSSSVTPQEEYADDDVSSTSSIGSLDAIDRVEEDVNRTPSSRATGYMGKNSEVIWMQRVRKEAEQRSRKLPGFYEADQESDFAIHSVNYHLDDMDISVPGPVHVYWMPPRKVADQLFQDYLETVHPFFPIVNRTLFSAQYKTFFDSAARPGDKWLAILNMIFAISAKHAHLTQAPWRGDDNDHLVYLTRARILSMNGDVLFSHPDLQQVQVEGLIAYYLLSTDQINRAWRIAALAVRSAITLGLNMKNTSENTAKISKEARYRVWWCLYTFEHMLGIMTGRASCISDGICTTPLPLPFEEEQLSEPAATRLLNNPDIRQDYIESALASSSVRQMPSNPRGGREAEASDQSRETSWLRNLPPSSALGFLYYVDLAVIAQEIVNRVYSLDCVSIPWSHIENRIGELRSRIDLWYQNLHEAYDFSRREDQSTDVIRAKLFLAFHYYSARITLGRPCLCRRDARQTAASKKPTFSHEMAVITLDSSRRMLDLMPDVPDAARLYQVCPWWCILHYLMQATSVLLLELSFGCIHKPEDEMHFLESTKKAIRWLFAMAQNSLASRRAWELCFGSLRQIACGMDYDISDMPVFGYDPRPHNVTQPGQHQAEQTANSGPVFYTSADMNQSFVASQVSNMHYDSGLSLTMNPQDQQQQQQQYQHNQQQHSGMPMSFMPSDPSPGGDAYFPYDPISGEFIRSFFPSSGDEDQPWG
ncbi:Zn(II)2Cys6 transcription factor [Aspergillus fijiensis CBS 313.89]|uniref:C6 transcription factor n=1 Tax=Aspergillus fijiensis CBS 313.89 TaxID=1448319 RepID=A0A8G1RHS3_9EURO|nr:C6 transcription factor [Aspergillus fijiensis CBS 313.89]RAK71711.1 C6 transcription factor [Aspergillus fijiensis CBS 313.89]